MSSNTDTAPQLLIQTQDNLYHLSLFDMVAENEIVTFVKRSQCSYVKAQKLLGLIALRFSGIRVWFAGFQLV